ncbi:hypothetical protein [Pseudomonas taiwanensis]|uniref:hypothetical protein n=1 Tax=Pseudomonas taiwanensis TaxID=470150 RepID=UPI0015BEFC9F|nr:hypothetical protein [Pseudomonas taiwanensis]
MYDYESIQKWLLGTIWGVLLLGVIGSIIGAILIFLLKRLWQRLSESKEKIIIRILFPLALHYERGEKIRSALMGKEGEKYISYLIVSAAFLIFSSVFFVAMAGAAISTYVVHELSKPQLLAGFVGGSLYLLSEVTKRVFYIWGLVSWDIHGLAEKIKKDQPKKFSAWWELRNSRPEKTQENNSATSQSD